ncbi:LysR family transcriptional regulator [Ottowia testudinis]|uniref:LysR family transcriptional regulator n=1 Tax=Ottowia testudinis TaxID=2816950 RepID=A0A975CG96_9BURK|nr:LysR family transcriptional regulator [Ottowia testudinis]QTD45655.1 LysR family transcriptional regulator [Ottowia testudinis]
MSITNPALPDAPLAELQVFAAVAEAGGFRAAATRLGVTPSALSHGLRKLETRLGVRLLHRTTRSVAPTEAGARLLATLAPALAEIRQAVGAAVAAARTPQGQIRLTAPRAAAHLVLMPLIARFLAEYPRMAVELSCDEALVDIVAAGFDAGLRFGESLQADMVALPVGAPQRFTVVASPDYLACHGAPADPAQLTAHACIKLRFPSGRLYAWQFVRAGRVFEVQVPGAFTVNDQAALLQAAEAGLGLAYTYCGHAAPLLARGRLVAVLPDWLPPAEQLYLYYPSRRLQPAGFQALLEVVKRGGADVAAPSS